MSSFFIAPVHMTIKLSRPALDEKTENPKSKKLWVILIDFTGKKCYNYKRKINI